ncbi:hypothetical protein N2152v2_004132 [Parachlorella kessleri]
MVAQQQQVVSNQAAQQPQRQLLPQPQQDQALAASLDRRHSSRAMSLHLPSISKLCLLWEELRQGYAYTIPSPYAIYNPALTAAYTAALQALQAATPPAPPGSAGLAAGASSGPGGAAGAAANSAAAAAYNAARQSLQAGGQLPWGSAGAPGAGAPAGGPGQAAGAAALSTSTVPTGVGAGSSEAGAATAAGTAARPAGIAGQQTTAPVPTAGAAAPGHAAPAAAGMNGLGPAAGLGSLPPLALPLGAIAYVPAFIPIPQPVLTAIPNHSLQQYAQQVAAAQQGGAGQAGEGQQQPGQAPFMQGPMAPGLAAVGGQFFPAAGVMFPVAAQHPMQFHMGEPGEQLGLRRRRGDPNNQQAGALPPEVIEAMRAAQARGQLPNHLAPVLAQLQRQQAARRAEARRVRGFQIQINLGRINLRAVMQLLFMVVIMAPYFSMRRLALMLAVAAVLNIARLEGVRRALNRLVGQHHLPLHPEQPQQAQQQGQGQGEAGGAAGGFGGGAGAVPPAGAPGLAQQGQGQGQHNGAAARGPVDGAGQAGAALFGGVGAAGAPAAGIAAAAGEPAAPGLGAQPAGPQLGQQQQQQRGRPGIVQEIQALVVGFITSLLPGWNVNPEDAAAFAAAEEAARAEEQAAAAGGFAG